MDCPVPRQRKVQALNAGSDISAEDQAQVATVAEACSDSVLSQNDNRTIDLNTRQFNLTTEHFITQVPTSRRRTRRKWLHLRRRWTPPEARPAPTAARCAVQTFTSRHIFVHETRTWSAAASAACRYSAAGRHRTVAFNQRPGPRLKPQGVQLRLSTRQVCQNSAQ